MSVSERFRTLPGNVTHERYPFPPLRGNGNGNARNGPSEREAFPVDGATQGRAEPAIETQVHASGSPASKWLQVDGAAAYMGGVSRKTVYAAVAAGLRVVRLSELEPRRDTRGRLIQGRMLFNTAWIDEFLEQRASAPGERTLYAPNSLNLQVEASSEDAEPATSLQGNADRRVLQAVPNQEKTA